MYRIVQWATGAMGRAVLRAVIDDPTTELVGLYVYDEAKVGLDAGAVARRPDTGVHATNDVEQILALDADVVVHAARLGPYGSHDDDLVALLASGKNVISINGYSFPDHWSGPRVERLREACRTGSSTLVAAGLNPGFIGEQLATTASGLCLRVDHVEIVESVDNSLVQQPAYLFDALGFGSDPDRIDPNDPDWGPVGALNGMFTEVVAAVAHRLDLRLDAIVSDHRVHHVDHDVEVSAGRVPAGTVTHTNWRWNGVVDDTTRITLSIHWHLDPTHLPRQPMPLWQVGITGHPGVRITMDLEKHPDDPTRMTAEQYGLAASVLHTVPALVAAEPGLMPRPLSTPWRAPTAGA